MKSVGAVEKYFDAASKFLGVSCEKVDVPFESVEMRGASVDGSIGRVVATVRAVGASATGHNASESWGNGRSPPVDRVSKSVGTSATRPSVG